MPTTLIVYDSEHLKLLISLLFKLSLSRVGQQLRLSMIANTPELPISLLVNFLQVVQILTMNA